MTMLTAPPLVSGRPRAQEFTAELAHDLSGIDVTIDWRAVQAAAPSFVDELVKAVLVERRARTLHFVEIPERSAAYARRSASRREVEDRLSITTRSNPT